MIWIFLLHPVGLESRRHRCENCRLDAEHTSAACYDGISAGSPGELTQVATWRAYDSEALGYYSNILPSWTDVLWLLCKDLSYKLLPRVTELRRPPSPSPPLPPGLISPSGLGRPGWDVTSDRRQGAAMHSMVGTGWGRDARGQWMLSCQQHAVVQ